MKKNSSNKKIETLAMVLLSLILIVLIASNIQPTKAEPATIYVDDDNTSGPWDGTPANPFKNITSAVSNASDGDTIIVYNGTYSEQVEITKSLNITSYDGPEGTIVNATGKSYGFGIGGADNVSISGFTIVNATGSGNAAIKIYSSSGNGGTNYNYISNNILKDNRYGVYIRTNTVGGWTGYTKNNTIENNIIESNLIGIAIQYSGNNTITYNNISNNDYVGIYLQDYSTNDNITYNNIFNNTDYEFFNDQPSNVTAENNWWGTTNTTIIDSNIYDYYDDNSLGVVDYDPFLNAPYVPNTPPSASNLNITPSSPVTTDNLVGNYTYYDADGDSESGTEIRWYNNSVLQPALNNILTVGSGNTTKGETWYFTVRPKDGTDFGSLQISFSVTIQNSPPSIDTYYPPTNPTINEGESQVFNITYSDPDSDPITVQWYLNGTPTVNTDSYTFTADYDDAGTYNVTVVISDDELTDSQEWTLTVLNVNRAPTIDSYTPTDLTPDVNEGQNLEFTHASSDPDSDPLTYSWLLDSVEQATTQNWIYYPGFDEAGTHNVTLVVSDGEIIDSQQWNVTVIDTQPVGGIYLPVNKFELLAPYIAVVSVISLAVVVAAVVFFKRKGKKP